MAIEKNFYQKSSIILFGHLWVEELTYKFTLRCKSLMFHGGEYLREFSKKIEINLMLFSGGGGWRRFMIKPEAKNIS
jgi:hypothetical protein